jgi:hypothetical protein
MTDDAFIKTLGQETARQAAMLNGDPGPMINYWADSDDITLFGGWEPFKKGHKPVTDTMNWVGSRFTGADGVDLEHLCHRLQRRPRLHGRLRAEPCQRRRRPSA